MLVTKLRIDGQVFYPTPDTDAQVLRAQIVSAVRSGGDFVEFETHGHGQVAVLITQHIPVRFETVERTEEEVESWETVPPSFEAFDSIDNFD